MLTITFMSMKGGTGKTTVATWLAAAFHDAGHQVALIDADPTMSALEWNDLAYHLSGSKLPFPVYGMATADLAQRLRDLRAPRTITVIDTPQMENHKPIAAAAIRISDEIVLPVSPTPIELNRTSPARRRIQEIAAPRVSVLLNRCITNALSTGESRRELTRIGFHVLTSQIPRLELYAQSLGDSDLRTTGTAFEQLAYELLARAETRP
jgi:chromosome partitioning protein